MSRTSRSVSACSTVLTHGSGRTSSVAADRAQCGLIAELQEAC